MIRSRLTIAAAIAVVLGTGAVVGAGCGADDEPDQATTQQRQSTEAEPFRRTESPAARPRTTVAPGATSTTTTPGATNSSGTDDQGTPGVGAPGEAAAPAVIAQDTDLINENVDVFRPFAADSPWNVRITAVPVDPRSDELMRLAQFRVGAVETPDGGLQRRRRLVTDGLFINTRRWTTPVFANAGDEVRVVCRQVICGPAAPLLKSINLPLGARPDPRFDGWFTVLDRSANVGYDFWRARRVGDTMSYQFLRKWELDGRGYGPPVNRDPVLAVSARGSGLPLFAGLITPDEIRAGRIDHALAIAVPGPATRNYVQPASVTDGNGDSNALPEGARIRLKPGVQLTALDRDFLAEQRRVLARDPFRRLLNPSFQLTKREQRLQKRSARAIARALRLYGAIVVERAAVPTLYAQANYDWCPQQATSVARSIASVAADVCGPGGTSGLDDTAPINSLNAATAGAGVTSTTTAKSRNRAFLLGNEVQSLKLSDFEVVQLPPLLQDPPLNTGANALQ